MFVRHILRFPRTMICRNERMIREQITLNLPVEERNGAHRINSNERAHMIIRKENASFTWWLRERTCIMSQHCACIRAAFDTVTQIYERTKAEREWSFVNDRKSQKSQDCQVMALRQMSNYKHLHRNNSILPNYMQWDTEVIKTYSKDSRE